MISNAEPIEKKQSFLRENELFAELELSEELKPIGKLQEIDLSKNEIWLLQCPKGMNVAEFGNQKLKIPGRTNIKDSEAISVEFNNGKEQHAFAYYNRKGQYYLRLLPVRGTIVVRENLKAAETVASKAAECFPPAKRVPLPSTIRVRHPLLGSQYSDKITLDNSIKKRLQKADEDSTQILKENLSQKLCSSPKTTTNESNMADNKINSLLIEINSDNEDEIEFVGEETLKKKNKKSKRKRTEGQPEENIHDDEDAVIKKKKSKKSNKIDQTVAEDLQWLQNI